MHFSSVLVQCLRVNGLKREWWIDLPELTSIRLGEHAFSFSLGDYSTELIMRSGYDEMKWWIDLPKLATLTTVIDSDCRSQTFYNPFSITLESYICLSILTNRHALSHHCCSWQKGFQLQGNRSNEESLLLLSLISRHHSCSPTVSLLSSFFHTPLFQTIHPTSY